MFALHYSIFSDAELAHRRLGQGVYADVYAKAVPYTYMPYLIRPRSPAALASTSTSTNMTWHRPGFYEGRALRRLGPIHVSDTSPLFHQLIIVGGSHIHD